ncbi:hypothetical protein NT01EI_1853 [Edwardsiella ictaluri 93-146]|uniref:Uncharacterized protein n=1 Tax=Edwardsiella ictaluri (strain 93-146) TaxID=634503 RepID=C5BGV1_EDWI9|nr:hypothetical protein NT01EI_1853 [Edwardsiella ictaluri 93-146]
MLCIITLSGNDIFYLSFLWHVSVQYIFIYHADFGGGKIFYRVLLIC